MISWECIMDLLEELYQMGSEMKENTAMAHWE
jgi:hypothetical protein